MLRLISYAALVGTSGVLLYLWINIWIYGYGGFYEDNAAIWFVETILWSVLILLGIGLSVRRLRERR